MKYRKFIESKVAAAPVVGFDVSPDDGHPKLLGHQRAIRNWALRGGRRGIFADFGLGKTFMQIDIMAEIARRTGKKCLIVCPLGVRQEFTVGAKALDTEISYIRNDQEALDAPGMIVLTNYERVRDGQVTLKNFVAVTLDEADALRSDDSLTHQTFIKAAEAVPYKFVATATPAPNDYMELIFYAAFLGIMDKGQTKTRFFKRDSSKADHLTLYPHKEEEFWKWIKSWGIFLQYPSDLGFPDEGYILPGMKVHWEMVNVDNSTAGSDRNGQGKLFRDAACSLAAAAREKRDTIPERIARMRRILEQYPDEHFILWHDLESEREAIKKAVPAAAEIYGALDLETREQITLDFADGKLQYLATKPRISGAGCNFQRHCHRAIFLGISHKFRDFIQAIHRILRFMQPQVVEIYIIFAESESPIVDVLKTKWRQHDELMSRMRHLIQSYGLAEQCDLRGRREMALTREETSGQFFRAIHNDCVLEAAALEENSVDLICTSIPFSIQYEYSNSYFDFGHNRGNAEFFRQMDYLIPELLRALRPGRVAAIHVKDRIIPGNFSQLGMASLYPFSDETRQAFAKHGFIFFGRITIVTDVVRENNQTYRLSWQECRKDGTKMGVGVPEYILLFRKLPTDRGNAYADAPVVKSKAEYPLSQWQIDANSFWRSSGERLLTGAELANMSTSEIQESFRNFSRSAEYDYSTHLKIAENIEHAEQMSKTFSMLAPESIHPDVWTDIVRIRTLNTTQSQRRREQHVCPLQFDIVERIINRYSNPGEAVLDPFGGIMTVPYLAVKMNRNGIGIELNRDYYKDGVNYLNAAEAERSTPTLFDFLETTERVAK